MLKDGQIVGMWELVRRLGAGTFGEVWLARHTELGHELALKIPTDPNFVRQLRMEGRLQFNLRHPNIVVTHDLNTRSDPPYVVMEFVDGKSLRQVIEERGRLPPEEALNLLRQILAALACAHGQAVLHRDLKPENILIAADGTVKVTDFGLGKVQEEVTRSLMRSGTMSTMDGHPISGTLAYMSPEQQDGAEPSPADDVYALGILGFEMLVGRRPSAMGIARPLQKTGVSTAVVAFLERACEEKDMRYVSAGAMGEAFPSLGEASPVDASVGAENATAPERESGEGLARRRQLEARGREVEDLDRQIAALKKKLDAKGAAGVGALDEFYAMVEKKEQQERELERLRREAEEEKRRREAEIARMTKEEEARRKAEFEADWGKYQTVMASAHASDEIRAGAWRAICGKWEVEGVAEEPGQLVWREGRVVLKPVDRPFSNGLGMKFVTAGTDGVLFSVWQTRVQDFLAFLEATGYGGFRPATNGVGQKESLYQRLMMTTVDVGSNFTKPSFAQGPDHPVVNVSWDDAKAFCQWLTEKECSEGRLTGAQEYRLPTDAEWSVAVGLENEGSGTPKDKDMKIKGLYPWGTQWPPPRGAGNYDLSLKVDDFAQTSPVGSFEPNRYGLYDMGGNVWEWCEDFFDGFSGSRVLRGASWALDDPDNLLSSYRSYAYPDLRFVINGFRCVLTLQK